MLPKLRSRGSLPEQQFKSLKRHDKREAILKLQDEMKINLYKPAPPKTKQVNINDKLLTSFAASVTSESEPAKIEDDGEKSPMTRLMRMNSEDEKDLSDLA